MAKWDEILTLPVQNPPTMEFSSADIVWSRVEGWQDGTDRVALIPFDRVDDFVRGESNKKECPTRFHVEARRRRSPKVTCKPKVDGILEYILYWCSFGPDDHREGGSVRPSRSCNAKRKTPAGRPSTKRGCVCHFIIKRLIADPSVALIIYNFEKHVDKQGLPCHGPQDQKAVGTRAMFAPYISEELRLQVMSLLHVGVPVEAIMQRHAESVEQQGGPSNRDDLLTHRYVRSLERKIRRSSYELDQDDAVSVGLWVEANSNYVFYHKHFTESEPFTLGIQSEWQLQQMIRFCNRSILVSDSTFGSNKLKYPLHSLLAFDSKNNAIPVAWIIAPQFSSVDIHLWLRALYNRVRSKDPSWKLGGFIVDDPSADVNAIRGIFQCSVLLSFWRVRRSWHKNLIRKCPDDRTCIEVFKQLGKAMTSICREGGGVEIFENFLDDFVDCTGFIDYFKASWFPRLATWCDALKTVPLAGVETSAAIESYHNQLKLRLTNENDPNIYQHVDWLVYKLVTKVHSYCWLDVYAEKDSFTRYSKNEWKICRSPWFEASSISDLDVQFDNNCAKVVSQDENNRMATVWNPGSEFAICECNWSRLGNLCKHVIKMIRLSHSQGLAASSISLHEYRRTLMKILSCPPSDSLILDHCAALAVSVLTQLNSLVNLESAQHTSQSPCFIREKDALGGRLPSLDENSDGNDLESAHGGSGESFEKQTVSGGSICQLSHIDPMSFLEEFDSVTGVRELKRKRDTPGSDAHLMLEEAHENKVDLSKGENVICNSKGEPVCETEECHRSGHLEGNRHSHDVSEVVTGRTLGMHPTADASSLVSVSATLIDDAQENRLHHSETLTEMNKEIDTIGCHVKSAVTDSIKMGKSCRIVGITSTSLSTAFTNAITEGDVIVPVEETMCNMMGIDKHSKCHTLSSSFSAEEKPADGIIASAELSQNKANIDRDNRFPNVDNSVAFTAVDVAHT